MNTHRHRHTHITWINTVTYKLQILLPFVPFPPSCSRADSPPLVYCSHASSILSLFVCVCVCNRETRMLYKYTDVWLLHLHVNGWIYIHMYLRLYSFFKSLWLFEVTGAVEPSAMEADGEHRNSWRSITFLKIVTVKLYHFVLSCYYCVVFVVELDI